MLVEDDRDFLAPAARDELDVPRHAGLEALHRVRDVLHLGEDALLEHVHPVVHDLDEQLLLALDVVVEPGLGETAGVGNLLDAGALVALLADEPRCGLEDGPVLRGGVVGASHGGASRLPLASGRAALSPTDW